MEKQNNALAIATYGMITIAIVLSIVFFSFIILYPIEKPEDKIYKLISLFNDREVEGNFFLGTGSIGETEYYYSFIQTEKGIKRFKADVSRSYIIEDTNEPYVRIKKNGRQYDFHVPAGTIIRKMELK